MKIEGILKMAGRLGATASLAIFVLAGNVSAALSALGFASFNPGVLAGEMDAVSVPQEAVSISEELGSRYSICPELIQAVCWTESGFDPDAENSGCIGIMQIYERWNRERMARLGVTDLHDMRQNMAVGADCLAELFAKYGDAAYALDVYNGNSKARWNYENGIVSEYAEGILKLSEELERKNGK